MRRTVTTLAILATLAAAPLAAQVPLPAARPDTAAADSVPRYLRPALGLHLGYAAIENAGNSLEVGASVELGAYRTPRLRFALGVNYLSSDTERAELDGSFSDLSVDLDLRYKPFKVRSVAPYLGVGVGFHFRGNDYTDPNISDLYDGLGVGAQFFGGMMVDGNAEGRWGVAAEVRGVRAQNIHRTSVRAGLFLRL